MCVCYYFGIVDLSVVVTKMREFIASNEDLWYVSMKRYFGKSTRYSLPGEFVNLYLDTTLSTPWHQSLAFDCREVQEGKVVIVQCVRSMSVSHLIE